MLIDSKCKSEVMVADVVMEVDFDVDIPTGYDPKWVGPMVNVTAVWHHGVDLIEVLRNDVLNDIEQQLIDQRNNVDVEYYI